MDTREVMRKTLELAQSQLNNYKNVPMTDGDLIAELRITIEQQAAKIAELEAIINESQPAYSNKIVPDSQCKQSKCANATTGCVGHCRLDELSKGLSVTYTCQLVKEK